MTLSAVCAAAALTGCVVCGQDDLKTVDGLRRDFPDGLDSHRTSKSLANFGSDPIRIIIRIPDTDQPGSPDYRAAGFIGGGLCALI